jgi:hypothetical protein
MNVAIRSVICALVMVMLSSCAGVRRETRLIHDEWPKDQYYVSHEYKISALPRINLRTWCSDESSAFIGPLIIIPLPVIPNPFWPFEYMKYKKQPANFFLTIEAPPKTLNWDNVKFEVRLNGNILTVSKSWDDSTVWKDQRRYTYTSGLTCGAIEGSEILVSISGLPETIETKLLYTYRWRIYAEGP